jgi:hypothetical protein
MARAGISYLDAPDRSLKSHRRSGSSLPASVSDAIAKVAQGSKVGKGKVESVTRGGAMASYETTITRNGQRREVAFNSEGAPVKAD